jgi:MerR family transcriptional regulator, heat shock protein HspR
MAADSTRSGQQEVLYPRSTAARLARVSIHLVRYCEKEKILQAHPMEGGEQGYTAAEVRRLARIRRLRDDLGLDMAAVEVVLNLRRRVVDLLDEVDELERRMAQREQDLLKEIQELRRNLAQDADWW